MSGECDGIWVIIPAYNEAATIRDIVLRTLAILPRVIVVDDGSVDGTSEELEALPVVVLRNETNRGKAAALVRGFAHALDQGASRVITLDGDGQHRPDDIPLLIEVASHHPRHIVIGARLKGAERAPKARRCANRVADICIGWAAGHRIADSQSGFRLYPAELLFCVRPAHDRAHGFVFESELLIAAARAGFFTTFVPVAALYPMAARKSHFRPVRDIAGITRMLAWHLLSAELWPSLAAGASARTRYHASDLERKGSSD